MGIDLTHEQTTSTAAAERWPRWRVWTIRIWYALLGVWALAMSHSVVSLALGHAGPGERFGSGAVTAWKLLAVGGVFGIWWTGGRSVVAFQSLVVGWVGWLGSERLYAVAPPDDTLGHHNGDPVAAPTGPAEAASPSAPAPGSSTQRDPAATRPCRRGPAIDLRGAPGWSGNRAHRSVKVLLLRLRARRRPRCSGHLRRPQATA